MDREEPRVLRRGSRLRRRVSRPVVEANSRQIKAASCLEHGVPGRPAALAICPQNRPQHPKVLSRCLAACARPPGAYRHLMPPGRLSCTAPQPDVVHAPAGRTARTHRASRYPCLPGTGSTLRHSGPGALAIARRQHVSRYRQHGRQANVPRVDQIQTTGPGLATVVPPSPFFGRTCDSMAERGCRPSRFSGFSPG